VLRKQGCHVQSQQRPPLGDAFVDLIQEPGIAVLILQMLAGLLAGAFSGDHGRLGRFLGTLPGGPRFPFDPLQLEQFHLAGQVEVPYG